jgi:hypothetical protein
MNSRIASLENTAEPDVQFHHKHATSERKNGSISDILDTSIGVQIAGNLATQRLLHCEGMQPKLTISQPGDIDEQEADRLVDEVVSGTSSSVSQGNRAASSSDSRSLTCKAEKSPKTKAAPAQGANSTPTVQNQTPSQLGGGQPLAEPEKAFFESRLGYDLSHVRVHTDARAMESARAINALAYTIGRDVVFGAGQYAPGSNAGRHLLAHELVHVVQQRSSRDERRIQRQGHPAPTGAAPAAVPTVTTMREFIDLVRRIEAANPGLSNLQIAQLIMRTKFHSTAWDWLLPSTASAPGVIAGGGVTAEDVMTLSKKLKVTLPQGGLADPLHIIAGLVAKAETKAPGAGGAGGTPAGLIQPLPSGVSQLLVATWVGDVGQAAAEWMTVHPHPRGGTTMQNYMDEFAPEWDLIADVDAVAMTSTSAAAGFVFDPSRPLSDNLERFYFPTAPREGKNRRVHIFCSMEGLALEPDGITLSAGAITTIDNRVRAFADWFSKNDPSILKWRALNGPPRTQSDRPRKMPMVRAYNPIWGQWVMRANDWQWFAQKFRDFVQRNLSAEGP